MNKNFPILLSAGGKEKMGIANAHLWTDTEKRKRALRGFGLMWALSFFSIFLPLAHFILVPFFFLAGPLAYYWLKKQPGRIIGVEATCPFCQEKLAAPESGMNWPLRIICGHCGEPIRVDLVNP